MTLTTLLVLYTMFNQVSSALPDTAYIKMIDMWFFFCISLIFSVIIIHITVERLVPGEEEEEKDTETRNPNRIQVVPVNQEYQTGKRSNSSRLRYGRNQFLCFSFPLFSLCLLFFCLPLNLRDFVVLDNVQIFY